MFQRPLICTDLTDGLHRLVQFVPSLAAAGMKQIVFLHVVPLWQEGSVPRIDTDRMEAARTFLTKMLQPASEGIEVKIEIQSGQPLETIQKMAKAYGSDIILLGTPIQSLLSEKLFGSTTIGLCQRMTTPLMTLRPQLIGTYTVEELDLRCRHLFRHLLIPYYGDETSAYLIDQVKQQVSPEASTSLEACTLCWVVDDSGRLSISKDYQVEQAKEALIPVKAELEALGLQVHLEVREGNPVLQMIDVAQVIDISAIAISSSNLGKIWEWSVPSFAGEILRRSWHPVIFFPPGQ
jgi:nucleotide-binding universal stress UspA family protein